MANKKINAVLLWHSEIQEEVVKMPEVAANISDDLYKKIEKDVLVGKFRDVSEIVNVSLRKAYAETSRIYLRRLVKKKKITETSMLKELKNIRK